MYYAFLLSILYIVEEERFIRPKHTTNFPIQLLKWVLNYAGITIIYYKNLSYKINKKNLSKLKQFLQKEGQINKTSASLAYYVQRLYNQIILYKQK